jgi:hypothetical protein
VFAFVSRFRFLGFECVEAKRPFGVRVGSTRKGGSWQGGEGQGSVWVWEILRGGGGFISLQQRQAAGETRRYSLPHNYM